MESLVGQSIQITDLRQDIDGALKKTSRREFLRILRRGHAVGVIMRPETYDELVQQIQKLQDRLEGFEETLAIVSDKKILQSIKRSLAQIKQGKTKTWEEAFGEPL